MGIQRVKWVTEVGFDLSKSVEPHDFFVFQDVGKKRTRLDVPQVGVLIEDYLLRT